MGHFHILSQVNTANLLRGHITHQSDPAMNTRTHVGPGVSVYATPIDNTTYTAHCFLNGTQLITSPTPSPSEQPTGQGTPVCAAFALPDRVTHTLTVLVSVPPPTEADAAYALSGFSFDYILVQPSPDMTSLWETGTQDLYLPILDWPITTGSDISPSNSISIQEQTLTQIANISNKWLLDGVKGFHTTSSGSLCNITFTGAHETCAHGTIRGPI